VHKRIITAVKRVDFVRNRMSYIILSGHRCHIILLNDPAAREDTIDHVKESSYEKREHVLDKFLNNT
jgi:hypothetical protein